MLRFIKEHVATIDGIEVFPIISLLIFFAFFIGLGIYIFKVDKKKIDELKSLPLEEEN